jgi:hypothetical protein
MSLADERCPFFWWAQGVRQGLAHAGWPILWVRHPAQRELDRYAGGPIGAPPVPTIQVLHHGEVRDGEPRL